MSLSEIPNEIVSHILSYINDVEVWKILRLVCKDFGSFSPCHLELMSGGFYKVSFLRTKFNSVKSILLGEVFLLVKSYDDLSWIMKKSTRLPELKIPTFITDERNILKFMGMVILIYTLIFPSYEKRIENSVHDTACIARIFGIKNMKVSSVFCASLVNPLNMGVLPCNFSLCCKGFGWGNENLNIEMFTFKIGELGTDTHQHIETWKNGVMAILGENGWKFKSYTCSANFAKELPRTVNSIFLDEMVRFYTYIYLSDLIGGQGSVRRVFQTKLATPSLLNIINKEMGNEVAQRDFFKQKTRGLERLAELSYIFRVENVRRWAN